MNTATDRIDLANVSSMPTAGATSHVAQKPGSPGDITAEILVEDLDVSMAVGAEDVVEGKIKIGGTKSIVIRGLVKGDVECGGRVVVMPEGRILGNIQATALWVEGDIGDQKNPAKVNVGDLHLGKNSRVIGDCTYDTIGVTQPNRGIRGQLIPRSEADTNNA